MSGISNAWMTIQYLSMAAVLAKFSCVVFDNATYPENRDRNLTLCTDDHGLPCEPAQVPWDNAVGLMTNG